MAHAYDLDALKNELKNIENNIESIEDGLKTLFEKREQYKKLIRESEAIIQLHKNGMSK